MAPRPQRAPAALELVVKLQRQERPEERSGETRPRQGSRAKSRRAEQPHIGTNVALERDAAIAMVAIGRFTTNTHCKLASSMITPPRMGPKIGARSTGSPRTASARPTCCGPARCATSVNPIGTTMSPAQACSTHPDKAQDRQPDEEATRGRPGAPTERRSRPSAAVDADRWVAGGIARS